VIEKSLVPVGACVPLAWGGRQRAMETAQHWGRLPKNQPAEITMFQISEVQESPAFNGRRSFLTRAVYHDNLKIHARVLASLGIEGHCPAKLAT
jgi:hypothetical protein